ncbi:hypothetical protein K6119_00485 [Paracrocinitomix mangrovi]|uniref:hypothetical protein n=1 Tax=Paracrocinitomix mangrovi TaxID=2862509 RepID=UPI001C8E20D7|nr:hypothetical protein [Paracrocinitomix mangrovi]UKN01991.1 hypothetical protein K6119_00485 [Paracrocinitomix mangrovi]
MKIQLLLYILLATTIISCNGQEETEQRLAPTIISGQDSTITEAVLTDTAILSYFEEIHFNKELKTADDALMLTIADSLNSKDSLNSCFYFEVFTFSMKGADGFYAETVGLRAYQYVQNKMPQFANCFYNSTVLDITDMDNWAEFIYAEIQISSENQEQETLNALITQIENGKANVDANLQVVYDDLIERLEKKL